MHPINKKYFGSGAGKIAVRYHNGTSAVTGYIVKQLGTDKFRVTTNGTTMFNVRLAQTTGAATSLTAGFCTIELTPAAGGGTQNVRKLTSKLAFTTQGNKFAWVVVGSTFTGRATDDTTGPVIATNASQTVVTATPFTVALTANETVASWTIAGGPDAARFAIAGTNLTMTAKTFASPVDADANNTYVVDVRATDLAGNSTIKRITVTVTAS